MASTKELLTAHYQLQNWLEKLEDNKQEGVATYRFEVQLKLLELSVKMKAKQQSMQLLT